MTTTLVDKTMSKEEQRHYLATIQSQLLDELIRTEDVKNDAGLARLIEVSPPVISKLRHGHLPIGAGILMAISEVTGRPTLELKRALGMRIAGEAKQEALAA